MTLQELYSYLQMNGNSTAASVAMNTGESTVDIQALLDANTGATAMFTVDGMGMYAINPDYAPVTIDEAANDADALAALELAICSATECLNDVDVVLGTTGITAEAWARGNENTEALLAMLRCGALRTKVISLGLNADKLDSMLDSCDAASTVNTAMLTHHGAAGV
ncbi:hypothetical protein J9253_05955 [Thiothrix litoralis]|jgi:hypothetical protein|uniref:Uncharacterized protein n=1 Tax=Thiothrix litoralis TaxID=2891210 RepID=A0ABX7WVZ6_9GAMM|nr:hypothetical protein [Thiothrix litoralis]QTR47476.1 hypothetical protein J9253_05955 [Thiothrix litoralis]